MASQSPLQRLAAVIDSYFKASFLFDTYHSAWRQRVSPAAGTEEYAHLAKGPNGSVVPPMVRYGSVTAYDDVQSAAKAARAEGADGTLTEGELASIVTQAITGHSTLLVYVDDAAIGPCVRLKELVSEDDNPLHRTVHLKPVHQLATEEEIKSFAVAHLIATTLKTQSAELVGKLISSVAKRSFVDVSANGLSRNVFYAHIEFTKKATAELFVKSAPTYNAPDAAAKHYLPQLKAVMLADHQKAFEDIENRRDAERRRHALFKASQAQELKQETQQILEAKKAATGSAPAAASAAQASSAPQTIQVTEQFLTPGKTLKVPQLPPNVTWRDVKVKLSNLFPDEKRLIRVVKDHNGGAFIVLFSPEKMEPLLSAWAADTYCHNVIPLLVKVEGEEEKWAIKEYPQWVSGFVTKKVVKNAKGASKRLREE
eukprot:GILI01013041.1.p1 GENE.GILI01013041.1~~GILI01013041.1.p1  ORF type:complete len:427 (-),score=126.57 GILI01013041.1:76-1356(-)